MSYNKGMDSILAAFGLTRKSRLPVDGAAPRIVDGNKVWINPLPLGPVRWKRSTHRVMVECHNCGRQFSAGRLHQHVCKEQNVVCWCGHRKTAHNHDGECTQCECALFDFPEHAHATDRREDFHSDEGRNSADDEPYFPDA